MNDISSKPLEDLLDRIVAEYSERVAAGRGEQEGDLLAQVPTEQRGTLERCFKMIRGGTAGALPLTRALAPGDRLDGYRLVREIGRGGMSIVFEAVQEELERPVALKVLRPGLALEGRNVDRFQREALAIARLQHPHIVAIHGVGQAQGYHYLVMELVRGTTLEQVYRGLPAARSDWTAEELARAAGIPELARGVQSYEQALFRLLAPVVRAVGLAHDLGLIHRDIKPSNILIHSDGRAVVADFGLAKAEGDPALSLTGEPIGTPYYMSPEQAAIIEQPVGERSDVYSLGVTLYEGLTGRRPFEGRTFFEVLDAIRRRPALPPRRVRRGVSGGADAIVRKAMARVPDERYTTALELSSDMEALAAGRMTVAEAQSAGLTQRLAGLFNGLAHTLRLSSLGGEIVSERRLLGLPLIHIHVGPRVPGQPLRRARGWLAIGEIATGVVAIGPFAAGVVSLGAFALGGLALAGVALGGVTFGGVSVGILATGGMAAGIGVFGGMGAGIFGRAGLGLGPHVLSDGRLDGAARHFLGRWMPWSLWP